MIPRARHVAVEGRRKIGGRRASPAQLRIVHGGGPCTLLKEGTAVSSRRARYTRQPTEPVRVRQGQVEEANIDTLAGMVDLITIQRAYTANIDAHEGDGQRARRGQRRRQGLTAARRHARRRGRHGAARQRTPMNSSLRTSASGMVAQQRMVDIIANNLANVNTTGFKRSRVNFEDVLYENLQGAAIVNYQAAETVGAGADRQGRAPRGHRARARAGRSRDEAARSTWRSRAKASSRSSGPTARSPTRATAASACRTAGALVTNGGYRLLPGHHDSAGCDRLRRSRSGIVTVTTAGSRRRSNSGASSSPAS